MRPLRLLLVVLAASAAVGAPPADTARPVRIGVALSGGAALGLAHIGVLNVLEAESIPVSCVVGTSMGSMVGGVFAAGYHADEIAIIARSVDMGRLFSDAVPEDELYLDEREARQRFVLTLLRRGLVPALPAGAVPLLNVEFLLSKLLARVSYNTYYDFDRLPIPYRAVAVDYVEGEKVVLSRGRLDQAIRASIAIPGVFAPAVIDGRSLVDGGVVEVLPVSELDVFAPDFIIGVEVSRHRPLEQGGALSLIDVASRSIDLTNEENKEEQRARADLMIYPNVDAFLPSDFGRAAGLIQAGEDAARRALPELRRRLAGRPLARTEHAVPDRPLPVVRRVEVTGPVVTRPSTVRREITLRTGQVLSFPRLIDDLVRLSHTGLFDGIDYDLVFLPGDSVDVLYRLHERGFGSYGLGVRYDSENQIQLAVGVTQENLLGTGARAVGEVVLGNPQDLRAGIAGSRFLWLPVKYGLEVFWNTAEHPLFVASQWAGRYDAHVAGSAFRLGYGLGRNAYFNVGLGARHARYRFPAGFVPIRSSEWIIGPRLELRVNSADNLDLPRRGTRVQLDLQLASTRVGSATDFARAAFAVDRAVPLGSRFGIRPRAFFGASWGELPHLLFFRTGGPDLAGADYEEFLSPQRAGIGLTVSTLVMNIYGRHDYPLLLDVSLDGATFVPPTDLFDRASVLPHIYSGGALGLRTASPLGPARLSVGAGRMGSAGSWRLHAFLSLGHVLRDAE